jgi:hypothetical protein
MSISHFKTHEDGVKSMTAHLVGKNVEESACYM